MKKIFAFLTITVLYVSISNGQYYYVPHINAGQNPGGLNIDAEQPGTGGWKDIASNSAIPIWSSVQAIPFSFSFNGAVVDSLKASSTGVITFSTSFVSVPGSISGILPSSSIPDSSVCVWGLSAQDANDKIRTKTFGATPNRQFWIQYNSYSCPLSTGYTYWAVVLEETSNKIFVVDQRTYNAPIALSIGLQFDSTSAIMVSGSPNLNSYATVGGGAISPIDNSYYEFIYGTMPANEVQLDSLNIKSFVVAPGTTSVGGKIINNGSQPITDLTINYQVDNGTIYSDTKSGLNIGTWQSYNFIHDSVLNIPAVTNYFIKVWFDLPGDTLHTNDTLNTYVGGVAFWPNHKTVFEEATGTWCGWCPSGAVYMDSMAHVNPNTTVLISVHDADSMVVSDYNIGVNSIVSDYPGILADRKEVFDPFNMFDIYAKHIDDFGYADIDISAVYDTSTHVITSFASAHFAVDVSADLRFAIVYTEDSVSGISSIWNQYNNYDTLSPPLIGAGHYWNLDSSVVLASDMKYNHVARTIIGGFNGEAGSLPSFITAGSSLGWSNTYAVPVEYNVANMHVHALLVNAATGMVLNANSGTISFSTTSVNEHISEYIVSLFPNPASDFIKVNFNLKTTENVSIRINDLLGHENKNYFLGNINSGFNSKLIDIKDFNPGIYFLSIQTTSGIVSKKFIKQ